MEQTDSAELLALQRIDETCMQLQKQGNYLEALECMERGLVLRQHFFGSDSDEVWRACKTVGEMCNLLAMTYLQQEDFAMVLELLKKAEILTERDEPGKAVTFNNLACYYRRQGKLHAALQYLQKALKIEAKLGSRVQNAADTHLNACAVMSQLGRHQSALEQAQASLILLQEELFGGGSLTGEVQQQPRADRVAVLAIAYHNMGVEQEFLRKYEHSLQSYRKGVEVAQKYLGGNHAVTVTLRNSTVAARRAIAARDRKLHAQLTQKAQISKRSGKKTRKAGKGSTLGVGTAVHAMPLTHPPASDSALEATSSSPCPSPRLGQEKGVQGDEVGLPPASTTQETQEADIGAEQQGKLEEMISPRPPSDEGEPLDDKKNSEENNDAEAEAEARAEAEEGEGASAVLA
ncbi:unnamed protein product [Chrysoparadoxa australica]